MVDISFIVPVYNLNREELKQCIESVSCQSTGNNEIIIVDDGSSNGIEGYCDELGKQNNITVIHQKNQGLAVARNTGIEAAHGEWVVHVDGDDWVDQHLAESLLEASKITKPDIFLWGFILATGKQRRELLLKEKKAFDRPYECLRESILCAILDADKSYCDLSINTSWAKAYRREFLILNELAYEPQLRRAQDAAYNLRAFNRAKNVAYIDKALNFYRNDNVSLSRGYNPRTLDFLSATAISVKNFVISEGQSEKVKEASNIFIQRLFRMINSQYFQHKDNKLPYKEKKKLFDNTINSEPFLSAFNSGLKRPALLDKIADILYQKKAFALILIYSNLLSYAHKLKSKL